MNRYSPVSKDSWQGRIDDPADRDSWRWHQCVELINLEKERPAIDDRKGKAGFCFIGFSCDKGVEKNLGRVGTAMGPFSIRRAMSNLPVEFHETAQLFDAGNIHCLDGCLEASQEALARAVERILQWGLFPIVLGGGHEIAFGHYTGLSYFRKAAGTRERLGIVNFDAHFDLRPYNLNGPSSGTMFRQIADACAENDQAFRYFVLGIQKYGNTVSLFKTAQALNTGYVLAKDMHSANFPVIRKQLDAFLSGVDQVYLTICSDVFSSAFAPGVSAPQPFGLEPETVMHLMKHILLSNKVISFDIAEVSPRFDEDNHTAKLASVLIYGFVNTMIEITNG
ncbi:MAG: formimidoylglutamase [Bacteroidota bacterium]